MVRFRRRTSGWSGLYWATAVAYCERRSLRRSRGESTRSPFSVTTMPVGLVWVSCASRNRICWSRARIRDSMSPRFCSLRSIICRLIWYSSGSLSLFCALNAASFCSRASTRLPRRSDSERRNPAVSAANCLRDSMFSDRYSEVSSLATRAAVCGLRSSKLTEKAMVALVGRPWRGSTTSALIIFRSMLLRMVSTSASRVSVSRLSGYRLNFSMIPSRLAEVMTRWLMVCTRWSA